MTCLQQAFLLEHQETRSIIRAHVDHNKWQLRAFSTEQLRSQRWMINASPKSASCPQELKKALSVNEEAQVLHLKLTVQCFQESGRRLRPTARPRVRWSPQAFEAHCDFACIYASVLREGRLLASWTQEKEDAVLKAFYQKFFVLCASTFVNRCLTDVCLFNMLVSLLPV